MTCQWLLGLCVCVDTVRGGCRQQRNDVGMRVLYSCGYMLGISVDHTQAAVCVTTQTHTILCGLATSLPSPVSFYTSPSTHLHIMRPHPHPLTLPPPSPPPNPPPQNTPPT
jgi:hypothetical protein